MPDHMTGLAPCPLCGESLEIRTGRNPYGRHRKDSDCLLAQHAINIPFDVDRWNRRALPALSEPVAELVKRLLGADPDHVLPVDALRLYDQDSATFPLSPEDAEGVLDLIDETASALSAMAAERDEAIAKLNHEANVSDKRALERDRAERQVSVLREALEFYAGAWIGGHGIRARTALSAIKTGEIE